MEIQLRELIDQIKKDGVDAAKAEADSMLEAAKNEAERIIADARVQADKILAAAKNENERMVKSSEDAIRQAGRNLLISFRECVSRELKIILNDNVTNAYSSEEFAQLIIKVVEQWTSHPDDGDITVLLNTDNLTKLEKILLSALKDKIGNGVILKANDSFDGGFRIAVDNGDAYYDYSTEAVVDMLSNYLSPRVTDLLKEA